MAISITGRTPAADVDRRERLGISADDLAARAGISAQELAAYEQAKSEADANPTVAMRVGDALDELEREGAAAADEPEAHPT